MKTNENTTCFWSPSTGAAGTVNSIVATTNPNQILIVDGDFPEQCEQVKSFLLNNNINTISVETNAFGLFVFNCLAEHVDGLGITVMGHTQQGE